MLFHSHYCSITTSYFQLLLLTSPTCTHSLNISFNVPLSRSQKRIVHFSARLPLPRRLLRSNRLPSPSKSSSPQIERSTRTGRNDSACTSCRHTWDSLLGRGNNTGSCKLGVWWAMFEVGVGGVGVRNERKFYREKGSGKRQKLQC